MAGWTKRRQGLSTCIRGIELVIAGRKKNPIVIWNWVWYRPMWMNHLLGVMQMKWQTQEEERRTQMCPHFQNISILSTSLDPRGTGTAGWLWGVFGFLRTKGRWMEDARVAERTRVWVREKDSRFSSSNHLNKLTFPVDYWRAIIFHSL